MQDKAAPSPETPIVMAGRVGRRRAIAHMNLAAAKAGLRLGQAIAHATALVPGLVLHDLDAAGDGMALQRLALWAQRLYSPTVAADPPDGLVIDATGCAHLFGGEEKMLIDIRQRLGRAGLTATVAIADSWGGAHALARYSRRPIFVAPTGALGRELADLPLSALRLPADLVLALAKPGFDTIGELEASPKGPLAHRFGLDPIRRLDQAHARQPEPIEPVFAPETPRAARIFAEPIGAPETLARYLTALTVELCATLEDLGLGARSIDAFFHRVDNRIESARIGLSTPARDASRLAKLLCEKLETVDPGFGIDKMVLAAPGAQPLTYSQDEALGGQQRADLSGLIDTLAARLGPEAVYRLASADSDLPERSVRKTPAVDIPAAFSWPVDWPRPTRFFPRPEPIETLALLPDQPPASFTWRGVRRRVRRADGPERVFGEWWKADAELARSRDYFQVEDEGGARYWIYRDGDGEDAASGSQRWFMAGVFG
ncbi:nucleotidyltransferase [Caulobacter flavus]|uniref:DNA-directed DNA polymerase n=2 Tax=Caulobacter flavus TaxID=1679497 RepID=A0A2N5CXA9_9CAUL|nr:nucleotidyltransferase [Caulobacter flavus]PLR18396.1 nucleotidyltransferase [Caulobacter flavus]